MSKINILESEAKALKENILVIPDEILGGFEGFKSQSESDVIEKINENGKYMLRNDGLESNREYRQVIPYVLVRNSEDGVVRYAVAERTSRTGDTRLAGEKYLGFGGHVKASDIEDQDFMYWSKREIDEELEFESTPHNIRFLGLIRSNSEEVSKVHVGLVFSIDTDTRAVSLRENKSIDLNWKTVDEIKSMEMEGWSRILVEAGIL